MLQTQTWETETLHKLEESALTYSLLILQQLVLKNETGKK